MVAKSPKQPQFVTKVSPLTGGPVSARLISLWVYADGDAMVAQIPDIGVTVRQPSREDAINLAIHEMHIKVNAAKNSNRPVPWIDEIPEPPRGCERRKYGVS